MPVAFVLIALKLPRISRGASGFGSKVSIWLGPPPSQIRIAESAVPLVRPASCGLLTALRKREILRHRQPQQAEHANAQKVAAMEVLAVA